MRTSIVLAGLLAVFLFLTSCQGLTPGMQTRIVPPENRVDIPQNTGKAVWHGMYLDVDFSYSKASGSVDLAGTVNFADSMTLNFTVLQDFHISALFLDENGRVLDTQAVTTDRDGFNPVPFRKKLILPANAVALAFTYQGTAIEGGDDQGGGITHFWQ